MRRELVKDACLHVGKWIGLFALARRLTRRGLRILCYHGFGLADEARFRPRLFMSVPDFTARMKLLADRGYPVLSLGEALDRLERDTLPPCAVVITIDDGFHAVRAGAVEILNRHGFPATVYVTTYYVDKSAPIFRLVIRYMFARAVGRRLDCGKRPWLPSGVLDLRTEESSTREADALIEFAETRCSEVGRQQICRELGALLDVDYDRIRRLRILSLMDRQELCELARYGVDVQLHTHRHRFPIDDKAAAQAEVIENRRSLQRLLDRVTFRHFCYPSGLYDPLQWEWLAEVGVSSATTCEPGLNYHDTPRFGLHRFLDDSHVSAITFEAELCGLLEVARRCRRTLTSLFGRRPATSPGERHRETAHQPRPVGSKYAH